MPRLMIFFSDPLQWFVINWSLFSKFFVNLLKPWKQKFRIVESFCCYFIRYEKNQCLSLLSSYLKPKISHKFYFCFHGLKTMDSKPICGFETIVTKIKNSGNFMLQLCSKLFQKLIFFIFTRNNRVNFQKF